jgi:MYXO-CTERM domain-containing protein
MARLYPCLIVPVLLGAATAARADVILYNQPSDFPVSGALGVWASQNDTNTVNGFGNFATVYDDFTLKSAANVTGASWQGGYFLPPTQGPITAFTLTFWSNNAGQPGVPLLSQKIPGNANETLVGTEPATVQGGNLIYNYSTKLATPFPAAANTTYWLSIVPDLFFDQSNTPAFGQWGWHSGTGGDGFGVQDFLGGRFIGPQLPGPPDLAFTLSGTAAQVSVPEPASLLAWGLVGLGGVAFRRYRRRRAAAH